MITKTCTKCGETKAETEFPFRNKAKGKRRANCKTCEAARNKAWRENNRERYAATHKDWCKANPERRAAYRKNRYEANKELRALAESQGLVRSGGSNGHWTVPGEGQETN